MVEAPVKSSILADYEERFAGSKALAGRARLAIAGGIVHDGRYMKPFPIYIDRADGAHKWDVDGHKLIDYGMGHGALILGHNNPEVVEAARSALAGGTHFSAGHEREVLWAEQIQKLIPSAEQVRFTASGTESTLLACRIARAHTGKPTMLKFEGHFHGWNDYLLKGEKPPFERPSTPGVPEAVLGTVAVLPANDLAMIEERLSQGDVAGIILEPSGGSWAELPLVDGFLAGLRDLASRYGAVLIFDEVITGFRWSPGGAQARFDIIPDLTTMAKIVAGGMPGGAVAGKIEFMQHMAFKDEADWNATKKVSQNGTFNASPVTVQLPKTRDRAGAGRCFRSALLPPYLKKTKRLEALIPWLYLKGVSTNDFDEALRALFGESVKGLSPSTIARLKQGWEAEYADWRHKDWHGHEFVYLWADGIYANVRRDERRCMLVVVGCDVRGNKHFLAIEEGFRESTESWKALLLSLKDRGVNAATLAVGDGALGFWAALAEVYPETREQRCWVHYADPRIMPTLHRRALPQAENGLARSA